VEAKDRKNFLTTSGRRIRNRSRAKIQLLAVVKGSSATLRALLMAVVNSL